MKLKDKHVDLCNDCDLPHSRIAIDSSNVNIWLTMRNGSINIRIRIRTQKYISERALRFRRKYLLFWANNFGYYVQLAGILFVMYHIGGYKKLYTNSSVCFILTFEL